MTTPKMNSVETHHTTHAIASVDQEAKNILVSSWNHHP
eukprot:CAMPEP_0170447072 /NCGR_PEP_ID=MMETSP0117_2-20130122/49960_1 /TAXON_ID=400756 /ORGANISM="Durinskia baltica, Strain CSIRO CS-38" /LENGTH=37 /DNA_ID= /DNA_START= /DNA_END= /DNA_ORIENTATION=